MTSTSTSSESQPSPPHETVVERPRTAEALALLLYAPLPGYALVCVDRHPTRTCPRSLQQVADRLGDPRSPTEMKFVHCHERNVGVKVLKDTYDVSLTSADQPVYLLFKCGGDYAELDRLTGQSRDKCHKDALRSFCIDGQDKNKTATLQETLLHQQTKFKVSHLLKHWVKTRQRQQRQLDWQKEQEAAKTNDTKTKSQKVDENGGQRLGREETSDEKKKEDKDTTTTTKDHDKDAKDAKEKDDAKPKRRYGLRTLAAKKEAAEKEAGEKAKEPRPFAVTEADVKLNENSKCFPSLGPHEIVIVAGRSGACQLLAYVGKETPRFDNQKEHLGDDTHKVPEKKDDDDNDPTKQECPGLLEQALVWNHTTYDQNNCLGGFLLGIERKTSRFTLEGTVQIIEDRWNPITFGQYLDQFEAALDATLQKIRDYKDEQLEKMAKRDVPTDTQLRDKRLTKFGVVSEENNDDDNSDTSSEEEDFDSLHCICCGKDFISEGQYKVHLLSKKHKKTRKRYEELHADDDDLEDEKKDQDNDEDETNPKQQHNAKKRKPHFRGSPERIAFLKQRHRLRELVAEDRQTRKDNGGVLPHRLGVDGFRPVGTHDYPDDDNEI